MDLFAWVVRIILAPFRFLRRLFGGPGARTVRNSGAGLIAQRTGGAIDRNGDEAGPEDDAAELEQKSGGILFEQLSRPQLVERNASDLSIDEARDYASQADRFYTFGFSLFPPSDKFYEEVEQDYLSVVLGRQEGATDANFLDIIERYRRSLNANTARLFLIYTPGLIALALGLVYVLAGAAGDPLRAFAGGADLPPGTMSAGLVGAAALVLQLLLYHWPYKVTQQQNLLGLDNYITSKFSRINQKFQVAKRRAMNVERTKRMHQADELREEAGTWTIAYHWLALRLFFCEQCVRNAVYQIRRNTALYGVAGFLLSLGVVGAAYGAVREIAPELAVALAATGGALTVTAFFLIMRRATQDTLSVLAPREWNRFHLIDLPETIRDHVSEDKLQIVTFRDRNRLE